MFALNRLEAVGIIAVADEVSNHNGSKTKLYLTSAEFFTEENGNGELRLRSFSSENPDAIDDCFTETVEIS